MRSRKRLFAALPVLLLGSGGAHAAPVPGGINFQAAATDTAQRVHEFHDTVLVIIAAITVFVTALLIWVMVRYNRRVNPKASQFSHNTVVEVLWTVIPVLILVFIAYRSFPLLYEQDVFPEVAENEVVDVKVYGRQWFWSYIYGEGDEALEYDSNMVPADALAAGQVAQLSVDYPMVVPVGKHVRLSVTASDVIHSWAMPAFALKTDAIPGRLNQLWFKVDEPGVFYGQCSELCGQRHAYMPIEVRVLPEDQYLAWLEKSKASVADGRAYLDEVQPLGGSQLASSN